MSIAVLLNMSTHMRKSVVKPVGFLLTKKSKTATYSYMYSRLPWCRDVKFKPWYGPLATSWN